MLDRITIYITERDKAALINLAKEEFRDPRGQAALLIREGLQARGFLDQGISEERIYEITARERGCIND